MADSFEHILVTIKSTPRIFVTCSLLSGCRSCLFSPLGFLYVFRFRPHNQSCRGILRVLIVPTSPTGRSCSTTRTRIEVPQDGLVILTRLGYRARNRVTRGAIFVFYFFWFRFFSPLFPFDFCPCPCPCPCRRLPCRHRRRLRRQSQSQSQSHTPPLGLCSGPCSPYPHSLSLSRQTPYERALP